MSKVLYHLSLNTYTIEEFVPRIPESRTDWEDETNQRVCLSESIEGCLTGAPWGAIELEKLFYMPEASYLIRVYEFDIDIINKEDLIGPEELYRDGLVSDAEISRECWFIGNSIKPSRTYLIELNEFMDQLQDIYSYDNMQYILENEEDMTDDDLDSRRDYTMTEIYEAIYTIIPEGKRSKLEEVEYRISEIKDEDMEEIEMSILSDIEDLFGYSSLNSVEVVENKLKLMIDARIMSINKDRIDELLMEQIKDIEIVM